MSFFKILIEETKETNKSMNKEFKVAPSVMKQITFFACTNIILSSELNLFFKYKEVSKSTLSLSLEANDNQILPSLASKCLSKERL